MTLLQVSRESTRCDRGGVNFSPSVRAMSGRRKPVIMGLVLLICTITGHCVENVSATATPTVARGDKSLLRRIADMAKHVDESRSQDGPKSEFQSTSRKESYVEPWDLRNLKSDSGDQIIGE